MLAVGPHAVAHGGSLPGCEFSLLRHFHAGPCPEWQPCFWGGGQSEPLHLVLVLTWGASVICMQSGSEEKLAGAPSSLPLSLYFLLSFHTCPTPHGGVLRSLLSCSSLLSPRPFLPPGLPALYSSSGPLPPVLPGCFPGGAELRVAWLFAVSGALCQATFLITPFLLLFCTLGTFHE